MMIGSWRLSSLSIIFALVPQPIQEMLILENDDTTFHLRDALYVCEKLNVPLRF